MKKSKRTAGSSHAGKKGRTRENGTAQPESTRNAESLVRGWSGLAIYLDLPMPTVQRWVSLGMPLCNQGRFIAADPSELKAWVRRISKMPVNSDAAFKKAVASLRFRRLKRYLQPVVRP